MGNIHDRIQLIVDTYGNGKNTSIGALIGENEANIRGYCKNRMPKQPFLEKIVKCFDISAEWLLTGEGEMIVDNQHLNKEESGDTIVLPVSVWKIIQAQAESLVIRDKQLDARDRQIDELIKLLKSQMEENRKNDVRTDNATCADAG